MEERLTSSEIGVLMSGVALFLSFFVFLYKIFTVRRDHHHHQDDERNRDKYCVVPRGSWGWPLIGETIEFIACGYTSKPVSFMEKRKSMYGNVFKTHILGKAIIVSTDPEVNKMVLQNQGNVFVPCYPKSITELLGKSSILQMNGPLHKRVHSLIGVFLKSPQFKSRITRHVEKSVKLSLSSWENRKTSGSILVQEETKMITFEILVNVLLSIGPGEEMNLLKKEFGEFIKGLICIPINFPGTRLYKSLQAKKKLLKQVNKIVKERQMGLKKPESANGPYPLDAIDALLRDDRGCESDGSMQEIRLSSDFISGNIIEMMIPGEETLPTSMTLAVKFLTHNPLALAHLMEENMELKKRKDHSCEEYSWADYMSLNFTQNVISETLRLANIINAVWRKALEDVKIKGLLIPKGWCVLASFSSVHLDENIYENPYEFNPWRWKNINAASSNVFTPFGGGQRLCPGLELTKLEISIFLHHFVTTYSWTAEEDEIIYFPTVRMKKKLPITITPL